MFLAVEIAVGLVGLWLAAKLWLGGVGPLGLAVLRLAGIYAFTDAVDLFVRPLSILGWIISCVVYVALLMWLFELETNDSIMLALITWVLKIVAYFALVFTLMSQ